MTAGKSSFINANQLIYGMYHPPHTSNNANRLIFEQRYGMYPPPHIYGMHPPPHTSNNANRLILEQPETMNVLTT